MESRSVILNIFLIISVCIPILAYADDSLDKQKKALDIIADFAAKICTSVPLSGESKELQLTGDAQAGLKGLARKIAGLGINTAAKFTENNYQGLLQKDLPEILKSSMDCKKEVSKNLVDKLLRASNRQLPQTRSVPAKNKISPAEKSKIAQKDTTFKEQLGPFMVAAGTVYTEILPSATKEHPMPLRTVRLGNIDLFHAYVEKGKLYVNTKLYNGPGLPTVDIANNEFIVRPPRWDRNYDNAALEIVDENLVPRLQIIYKNERTVYIQGIIVLPHEAGLGEDSILFIDEEGWHINPSNPTTLKLRRIFKYPSRLYLGQELPETHL